MTDPAYVFLAGVGNSEPEHWQTRWYEELRGATAAHWVQHDDWQRISCDRWLEELEDALSDAPVCQPAQPGRSIVFVAHSLGCLLAAEWLDRHPAATATRALLVAPPDIGGPRFPRGVLGFRNALTIPRIPCRAILVASRDDPFVDFEYARELANRWHARFADVGFKGHINAESRLGTWPEGRALLDELAACNAP